MRKRVCVVLALVGVLLISAEWIHEALGQVSEIPAGLVGWWRFTESGGSVAGDSSGAGNDGTLIGAAFFDLDATLGSALEIRDESGGVLVPHAGSLEPPTGTIAVWFKVDGRQNSDLVAKFTDLMVRTNKPGWFSVYGLRVLKNGAVEGFVANDDPAAWGSWTFARSRTGLYRLHQWHHLVLRWDGNTVAIFLDGQLQAASPYVPVPEKGLSYHAVSNLAIAVSTWWGRHRPSEHDFIGWLADVRFFARPLSEEEIYRIYSASGVSQTSAAERE